MRLGLASAWKLLLLLSFFALLWALGVLLFGGFDIRLYGIRLASRDPYRPADLALAAALAAFILGPDLPASQAIRARRIATYSVRTMPILLAIVVLFLALGFGARAAGGADSYGYLSQAQFWLKHELPLTQPFATKVPWPNADWTFTPLGYIPGTVSHTLVPVYPSGLPIIMAGFARVFGDCGPYYVTPVAGAALVLLTYLLGRRVAGPAAGTLAALFMATSPTMLFQLMMPMTDVTVATLWTASVLWAFGGTALSSAGSGAAGALAILVRPNLAPLAVVPLAVIIWQTNHTPRALVRGLTFCATLIPGFVIAAAINSQFYGSPWVSGYGTLRSIYALANVWPNVERYPRWFMESQGVLIVVGFLAGLFRLTRGREDGSPWRVLFLFWIAVMLVPYLFYIAFDAWWYLRFVLPAFPAIFIVTADGVLWTTSRLSFRWRTVAVMIASAAMASHGWRFASAHGLTGLGVAEQHYADVGHFIANRLPSNAVCLAMQHSGSIRYYSHCTTLRYDILDPQWLDRSLSYLVQQGYHPYIVLDNWEREAFRSRFGEHSAVALLNWTPVAELPDRGETRIYDPLDSVSGLRQVGSTTIPRLSRVPCAGSDAHQLSLMSLSSAAR